MKIVLDTNVLVSGLLSPFQAPAEIVRMISGRMIRICYDARILSEYEKVLARPKFGFHHNLIEVVLDQMRSQGELVRAQPLKRALPDPNDEPFLEVAIAGGAVCLVTGNFKHYPSVLREGVKIFLPRDFLDYYKK